MIHNMLYIRTKTTMYNYHAMLYVSRSNAL